MKRNKGVSLILLVITVIVMIILTGAIILTINNVKIIPQAENAVDETNLQEVQTIASLIWSDAFVDPNVEKTQEGLEEAVFAGLQKEGIDTNQYIITVNDEGVKVRAVSGWVTEFIDGVPIPKGFVASEADGEKTKEDGLVIYEGGASVTDANVETAKRTRNQYVWVPVENFSDFKTKNFWPVGDLSYGYFYNLWEIDLDEATNMPSTIQNTNRVTTTTLEEVQAMYESVKQYKGFYIARYEAGLDVGSHKTSDDGVIIKAVHSKMNKAPYNYVRWTYNHIDKNNHALNEDTGGAVEVARSIYPQANDSYGVVSTLTYGVQWDSVLQWWIETEAVESVTISTSYGNYRDNEIELKTFNKGAKYLSYVSDLATKYEDVKTGKDSVTRWLLTTGATEEARVKNIYDMAGNLEEYTMQGSHDYARISRGATFYEDSYGVDYGVTSFNFPTYAHWDTGFRPSLYIKTN